SLDRAEDVAGFDAGAIGRTSWLDIRCNNLFFARSRGSVYPNDPVIREAKAQDLLVIECSRNSCSQRHDGEQGWGKLKFQLLQHVGRDSYASWLRCSSGATIRVRMCAFSAEIKVLISIARGLDSIFGNIH